ncbi:MAG: DUF192 domain-containing protein [Candidatus Saccharimonadales bacterium]
MVNKLTKPNVKKTKSGRSLVTIAIIAVSFAFIISLFSIIQVRDQPQTSVTSGLKDDGQCDGLQISDQCYTLERAETNAARTQGLSDRDSLADKAAMLFVFEQPVKQCIWMKAMRFDLDIIWLNEAKTITRIEKEVSPDTYPTLFCSDDTKYVIELNSGEAATLGLNNGTELAF